MDRRRFLQLGALGPMGLSLPQLLLADEVGAKGKPAAARSCILFFLEGGPSHVDLWDVKPEAPAEVRGEFGVIDTSAPGIQVCEHLPLLSRQMHHVTQVQSVHHSVVDHNAGAYYALTGASPIKDGRLIVRDEPDNFPPFGAVLSQLRPVKHQVPSFVHLPDVMSNNGSDLPGQRAGFLGSSWNPMVAGDPSVSEYRVPGLALQHDVSAERLQARRKLLADLEKTSIASAAAPNLRAMESHYEKAFSLLNSAETRNAFDLSQESDATRQMYGMPDRIDRSVEARKFGGLPHTGQCLLLSRRLIEAGTRLVTVCSGRRFDQAWDTHRDHFPLLKKSLLPYTDRALAALLQDLHERGLLQETLVVVMGEFGRTPKLGQITSGAGAEPTGRDHWPHCYTVMFGGGGVRGGYVHGKSDRWGAYPDSDGVTPEDIAATIYHAMGLNSETRIRDSLGRPHFLSTGKPIMPIFS